MSKYLSFWTFFFISFFYHLFTEIKMRIFHLFPHDEHDKCISASATIRCDFRLQLRNEMRILKKLCNFYFVIRKERKTHENESEIYFCTRISNSFLRWGNITTVNELFPPSLKKFKGKSRKKKRKKFSGLIAFECRWLERGEM